LQREFGSAETGNFSTESSKEKLLEIQRGKNELSPWVTFVESNELILKYGYIMKKKGLFSLLRKRMFLLTDTPRLIYIDPNTKERKGEIPFDSNLNCEPKNFKIFFVHTVSKIRSVLLKTILMMINF
jgi:3-phosphoinositide dependent protein kinase-1